MADETIPVGEILIRITEDAITYDSEFSLPEVVFWLDTVKTMLVKRVIEDDTPTNH